MAGVREGRENGANGEPVVTSVAAGGLAETVTGDEGKTRSITAGSGCQTIVKRWGN
jgi:hypothetical protein